LDLEEYAIRKTPHSRTPASPIDQGKLHWVFYDGLDTGLDRQGKRSPSAGRILPYHARACFRSASASGVQKTGRVIASQTGPP
jgi:hypothetical protein